MHKLKKEYLFICITQLQLITLLNILDTKMERGEDFLCDLVMVSDGRVGFEKLKDQCEKLNIFRKVIILYPLQAYHLKRLLDNDFDYANISFLQRLFCTPKILRKFFAHWLLYKKLFFKNYTDVYFYGLSFWLDQIFNYISSVAKIHLIDEGIGTYTASNFLTRRIDFVHVYEPNLVCINQLSKNKVIKLKKISLSRERLVTWLKSLFDTNTKTFSGEVFFDQPLERMVSCDEHRQCIWEVKETILRHFINSSDSSKVVRVHPWTSKESRSRLKKLLNQYYFDNSLAVPFEMEMLFGRTTPSALHTISSGGVLYCLFMFDSAVLENSKKYIYYPWFYQLLRQYNLPNQMNLKEFFLKVQAMYPAQVVFVDYPQTLLQR